MTHFKYTFIFPEVKYPFKHPQYDESLSETLIIHPVKRLRHLSVLFS